MLVGWGNWCWWGGGNWCWWGAKVLQMVVVGEQSLEHWFGFLFHLTCFILLTNLSCSCRCYIETISVSNERQVIMALGSLRVFWKLDFSRVISEMIASKEKAVVDLISELKTYRVCLGPAKSLIDTCRSGFVVSDGTLQVLNLHPPLHLLLTLFHPSPSFLPLSLYSSLLPHSALPFLPPPSLPSAASSHRTWKCLNKSASSSYSQCWRSTQS